MNNLLEVLNGRKLDYLVIHHLEPDHTCGIIKVIEKFPDVKVYISSMGNLMFQNFYQEKLPNVTIIKEGDELNLGHHVLHFISAPMVHWPEVMMSYDSLAKCLFSADAFGSFYQNNVLFADEVKDKDDLLNEARRYYTNIVGKYGPQVTDLLNKVKKYDIQKLYSLHGPIYRKDLDKIISKYILWSSYKEEKQGVLVAYSTIYGHTEAAAKKFFGMLKDASVPCSIIDLNTTDTSYAIAESFVYNNIVLFAPTFNMGVFPKTELFLLFMKARMIKNKTFYIVENGSWAPNAKNVILSYLKTMPGNVISPKSVTIKSSLTSKNITELEGILEDFKMKEEKKPEEKKKLKKWRCTLCGYIYEGEELPKDFTCPVCGASADLFEEVKEEE